MRASPAPRLHPRVAFRAAVAAVALGALAGEVPPCANAGALPAAPPPRAGRPVAIPAGESDAPRPNVLILVTDDQRARGTLEVMPETRRWFAEGGVTYPDAYVTTPVCCPSRASIFTGRYAHNHGVRRAIGHDSLDHRLTMQRHLRDAGYLVGVFGKYLNGWPLVDDPPYADRWAIQSRGFLGATFNDGGVVRRVEGYSTTFLADGAVDFLREAERRDQRPWALYVAPYAPHPPAIPEARHAMAPVRALRPGPFCGRGEPPFLPTSAAPLDRIHDAQLRSLLSVDDLVGRVFATLSATGELDNTLAVFLSDNGFLWGEHGIVGKAVPYTDALRTPLLVRWPGHLPAGAVDGRMVANVDVAPTVLDAVGIEPAAPTDGRSLLDPSWDRDHLLFEYWGGENDRFPVPDWTSVRTRTAQYVEYTIEGGQDVVFREYYDLVADPWQLHNLLEGGDAPQAAVARLSRMLARDRRCAPGACP